MARLSLAFQEEMKSQVGDLHLVIKQLLLQELSTDGFKMCLNVVELYSLFCNLICVLFMN